MKTNNLFAVASQFLKRLNLKHLSLIAAASLTLVLLVNAYSRTPLQSNPKPQTPTRSKEEAAQKAIENGELNRIVATCNKLLKDYPTAAQINKIADPKIRSLGERGRKLLEAGKSASGWSARQLSDYSGQLQQHTQDAAKSIKDVLTVGACGATCNDIKAGCRKACPVGTLEDIVSCVSNCENLGALCSVGCKLKDIFVNSL